MENSLSSSRVSLKKGTKRKWWLKENDDFTRQVEVLVSLIQNTWEREEIYTAVGLIYVISTLIFGAWNLLLKSNVLDW